jgi:hypothetical protein
MNAIRRLMMKKTLLLIAILAVAVLAACQPGTTVGEPAVTVAPFDQATPQILPTREAEAPGNVEPVPTTPPLEAMPALPTDLPAVQAAVADLSGRLSLRTDEIEVLRAEAVTWSDGSLGCPQPDVMYTQALVDGVWIQLRAGDAVYSYHGGGSGDPTLCESAATVGPNELPTGAVRGGSS